VVPLFLILVLGIVDFARGIFTYSVLSNAAREGARYAMVHGTLSVDNPPGPSGPGTPDPDGFVYVAPKARELALTLDASTISIGTCWGFGCSIASDCVTPTDTANAPVPDIPVTVRACYDFQPITASFLRVGPLRLSAQATSTITH
jgi:hypothetical protein